MKIFSFVRKPFPYTYNNVAMNIILINVIIYFFKRYLEQHGINIIEDWFALNPVLFFEKKMFWQVFTYMFLHGSLFHIFFNMLSLFWFGVAIERKMGSKEFLLFYLLCGVLAGLAMCISYYFLGTYSYIVGASGALYAVLFAFAVLYPDSNIYLYFVIPIPSAILVIGYFIIELTQVFQNDGVAHLGHFFGLLFAWLYIRIRYRIKPLRVFGFIK
ncbi:MAG: rhomboid family intramembrane serine protease [Treponema sp.]